MNVGSLFSGIGGVEIGFEQEGFETAWFVEREPYAQAILRKRFPAAVIYDDVTKIDFGAVPKVDVLTGGFPCQDISNAGKRAGIEGSRSSLWKYYLEAIRTIRPKFALIENVSALLGRGLDVVLADLASLGYDAEWHCVSASSVGALHKRDRIFIIAYLSSERIGGVSIQQRDQRTKDLNANGKSQESDVENTSCFGSGEESDRRIDETSLDDTLSGRCKPQKEQVRAGRNSPFDAGWWAAEPRLGRTFNGISKMLDGVDRE